MASQAALDRSYMDCAFAMSKLSHAQRKKVGAILVSARGGIIAEGINGTYSGGNNACEYLDIEERWSITDYDHHLVSTTGKIKRLTYDKLQPKTSKLGKKYIQPIEYVEKILPIRINKKGYPTVKINGVYIVVHRIVAKAFIPNPNIDYYNQINHIDHNKQNNVVSNLEWCTNIYNCCDRSQNTRQSVLPSNISYCEKGKFKYVVQYLKDRCKRVQRSVTLEEAKAIRASLINPIDYITYKYVSTNRDLKTKLEVLHAESNAIAKVAKSTNSSEDSTLYVTMSPCFDCAKLIIQSGIKRVVYAEVYRLTDGLDLLSKAKIRVDILA